MSIECPDVRHIIHLGVPEDNESYIQKSGHTGGRGSPALSLLVKTKHATHANKSMIKIYEIMLFPVEEICYFKTWITMNMWILVHLVCAVILVQVPVRVVHVVINIHRSISFRRTLQFNVIIQ